MASAIDVHAHLVAREALAEIGRNGAAYGIELAHDADGREHFVIAGRKLRPFFPELTELARRLPWLDTQGISRQLISTWTDISGDDLPPAEAARWARLQNETLAAAAAQWPERFEAMGTLPLQHPERAVAELDHIVRALGIRSVQIGTNINGRELDHPELRVVWQRLCDHGVLVLLHPPLVPAAMDRVGSYFLNNLLAYPMDTTIAAARLIFSGIMRDLPGLKVCLAHGGGFLPYQIGRFDRGFAAHPACRVALDQPPSNFLGAFFYDTLTHGAEALAFLLDRVGPRRVLFGTDYPFEMRDEVGPARLNKLAGLGRGDIAAVEGGNADALLGRTAA
jgi:aminocarboxymuconate-semialdehyde decarboxylase